MDAQYRYELIGRMQEYWLGLTCAQKVDIYFEGCGIDLREEFWRVPECPEYTLQHNRKGGTMTPEEKMPLNTRQLLIYRTFMRLETLYKEADEYERFDQLLADIDVLIQKHEE